MARSRNRRRNPEGGRDSDSPRAGTGAVAHPPEAGSAASARSPLLAGDSSADTAWTLIFGCWLIATASTLGALFFSEVMELPPCVLCWYQRIFMFPLALILPFGLFPFDRRITRYALPLAGVGWLIAVFHLLLVAGVIPESVRPCTQGVPCSDVQIEWLGFVTIPLLSFLAFSAIVAALVAAHFRMSK